MATDPRATTLKTTILATLAEKPKLTHAQRLAKATTDLTEAEAEAEALLKIPGALRKRFLATCRLKEQTSPTKGTYAERREHLITRIKALNGGAHHVSTSAWSMLTYHSTPEIVLAALAHAIDPTIDYLEVVQTAAPVHTPGALVSVDARTGGVRAMVEGRFQDLELSPDGRYAAVAEEGDVLPVDPERPIVQGELQRARSLRIVNIFDGTDGGHTPNLDPTLGWEPAPGWDVLPNLLTWSDRGELLVWMRPRGADWSRGSLKRIVPRSREVRDVPTSDVTPMWGATSEKLPIVFATWLDDMPVRRQQGVPWIRIVLDRQGRVLATRLERSSGVAALDQEALVIPRRAQPLPRPPAEVPGDPIELVVPVEFFLAR